MKPWVKLQRKGGNNSGYMILNPSEDKKRHIANT